MITANVLYPDIQGPEQLIRLVEATGHIQVSGAASSITDIMAHLQTTQPHLLFIHTVSINSASWYTADLIAEQFPELKIVITRLGSRQLHCMKHEA
ncbi:hypothetical protein Q5741_11000 [Paenibacillus sp. JX-17]|uniref:Uncharacterized protein n=1 Tax=Paenibacillus lacisoli TaxID=3064525 RepID=A0ABT9CG91_9BACL|nr:hypothetical protein [Paenibacillus sp. JX-17]MDO7906942.1 hypothetical protein [Paenibacillus sp. JX-17]